MLLNSIRGLSRPMQLSLRNTFRRRCRLALTLITLVLGGMLFMTVGSVRSSLNGLIETGLRLLPVRRADSVRAALSHRAS